MPAMEVELGWHDVILDLTKDLEICEQKQRPR